jgi:hypothetical protein
MSRIRGRWGDMDWVDRYSGTQYRVTTREDWYMRSDQVKVRTYWDVIAAYRVHPEDKSARADGKPCERGTVGLLIRRSVASISVSLIGKESNGLENEQTGLVHDAAEVLNTYEDPRMGEWEQLVQPMLQDIPARWLAQRTGLTRRTIQRLTVETRLRTNAIIRGLPAS